MAASHPHMLQQSSKDESKILKLVENHFLPDRAMLTFSQIELCSNGDLLKERISQHPITFFQWGFGLPACDFLCSILQHYRIELVHLNPNSILQISVFVYLCKTFLGIPPSFPQFKHYFFQKYQPSANNRRVIGGVRIQTRPCSGFLDLPLKTSL
jgi:hypothetical protein